MFSVWLSLPLGILLGLMIGTAYKLIVRAGIRGIEAGVDKVRTASQKHKEGNLP